MALPLPPGLMHPEVAFLADMEMVTIVPRQRLDSISLLGGTTPPLRPPQRADLPLWLALLLKKQRRANIVPPPWLHPQSLSAIIYRETKIDSLAFSAPPPHSSRASTARPRHSHNTFEKKYDEGVILSPPFLLGCTASAPASYLPYHWLEVAETLLAHAGDDLSAPAGEVRGLLRDLSEARAAKMRVSLGEALGGTVGGLMGLRGVGAMELAEARGFLTGVIDGVRRIGAGAEAARREEEEKEEEEEEDGGGGIAEESDEDML